MAVMITTLLWKYVTKIDKIGVGGGNVHFQCNLCQLSFKGTYYRVKAHLLKISGHGVQVCRKVTPQLLIEMQRLVDEAEVRVKRGVPKQVPLPPSSGSSKAASSSASVSSAMGMGFDSLMQGAGLDVKKRKTTSALEKAFNVGAREELHSEIARMFYSAGLPFHLARNLHYCRSYTFATTHMISGYIPPSYNMLRTSLLQKRANLERLLEPTKQS